MAANAAPSQVLMVEDNPAYVRLVQEMLADAGGEELFDLWWADRLSTTLELIDEHDFDLVLLDLGLPDSDGLETFERTQEHFGDKPIVLLTGYEDESLALTALDRGAQDYLIKGYADGTLLRRAIRYALHRTRLLEPVEQPGGESEATTVTEILRALAGLRAGAAALRWRGDELGEAGLKDLLEIEQQSNRLADGLGALLASGRVFPAVGTNAHRVVGEDGQTPLDESSTQRQGE